MDSPIRRAAPLAFAFCLLGLALSGCGKSSSSGEGKGLSFLAPWPRAHYQAGGSNAFVYFVLYGRFTPGAEVSAKTYRTAGLPARVDLRYLTHALNPEFPFTNGPLAEVLGKSQPALFAQLKAAPECLVLQGELPDPKDLNYLRDLTGLIMFSLDHGAIAVLDVQQLKLFTQASWRQEIFNPQTHALNQQVVILVSDEQDGTRWLHTRGLRKFGRPDLSFHEVSATNQPAATDLLNRFIRLQADGGLIPEGREVQISGLPPGLTCHHAGSPDDPDFNNVHVEIR